MYNYKKYVVWGMQTALFLGIFLLAACGDNSQMRTPAVTTTSAQETASPTQNVARPTQSRAEVSAVTATPLQSNGAAPIEITTPSPAPGEATTSQQVVLKDRTLIIESTSKQKGTNPDSVAVTIAITITATGGKAIQNQASFFHLVGVGGDFFGQTNSSDNFYGSIAARTSRRGTITFQLPVAAASSLHLMYRSEVATEALLLPLAL